MSTLFESKSHLHEIEQDVFFFFLCGLKPKTFHEHVKQELRAQKLWTNVTKLPSMDHVVSITKALLKHDLHYNVESDEDSDDESEVNAKSDSDSDSSSDDNDDESLSEKLDSTSDKSSCNE